MVESRNKTQTKKMLTQIPTNNFRALESSLEYKHLYSTLTDISPTALTAFSFLCMKSSSYKAINSDNF